jgi:CelD/BcsL family acetyltransferase involved in cellulose biosynthesis
VTLEPRAWHGHAAFAALARDWERLAARARLDPLCNSHAWTLAHARAFTPDADVFGWTLASASEVVAILALRREPSRGALALRRALFLADGSFDSDYLAPPIEPGLEREAAAALLALGARERGLEALVLAGLPDDAPFALALRAELAARGLPPRVHAVPCLTAALPDSFEAYLAARKPRMRSKVRAALRAAEEQGATLEWCTRSPDLEPWLTQLFELHTRRWQAVGEPGSYADPRRRAFHTELARTHLAAGTLALARLAHAGRPLALQLGLLAGERYYQLQEGYDPEHGEERVATALRALALGDLLARGVRRYDFMAGDSRHKRDWGGEDRPCTTIAFPLPKWRARLAYGLRAAQERWRAKG